MWRIADVNNLTDIIYEKKGEIAYVTFNRPDRLNAFTYHTLGELREIWEDFVADDELRVAILSGNGRGFCAGVDLNQDLTLAHAEVRPKGALYCDFDYYPKPIIAAIHGACVGGGMSIALGADIRVIADDAKLGYPQAKVGIISVGGQVRLPRFWPGLARYYLLTGDYFDAQEAYRLGLCHKVVSRENLMAEATEVANKILANSPLAVSTTKEAITAGEGQSMYEHYRISRHITNKYFGTEDYQEAVRAFLEKRKPVWKKK